MLYRSLAEHCEDFRLRIFCMDDETERLLRALALPGVRIVPLRALEARDRELLDVKPSRTPVEYCWTATPAVCLHALETEPELESITYLDADVMLFHDPAPLFAEMGSDSTMIVPHRYAPQYRASEETSGIFNVEWLTFRRDKRGLEALRWWRDRCIEWCYFRYEDGKMGDQKYLDDWPRRFDGVHVLEHPGGGLAPWNVSRYALAERDGQVTVDGRELVFYHYHSLRLYERTPAARASSAVRDSPRGGAPHFWMTSYPVSEVERRLVWVPYLRRLDEERNRVRLIAPDFAGDVGRWSLRDEMTVTSVRSAIRTKARGALARTRRLDPAGLHRYRDTWRSNHVATQMLGLTERQLADSRPVAPYRTFLEAVATMIEHDQLPQPARLIDLGCGVGAYGDLLERHFPGRFEYVGADYSEQILAVARRRAPGRRFEQLDLLADGVPAGYDVVLASALVDILAEWEQGLDRLLASDARYVLLHRQRVAQNSSHVEIVDGYRGQLTYASYVSIDLGATGRRKGITRRLTVTNETK